MNGKGEIENVLTERNWNQIWYWGETKNKGAENRRNTEGRKVENNVFSVENFFFGVETQETFFFFLNMN